MIEAYQIGYLFQDFHLPTNKYKNREDFMFANY